MTKKGPKLLIIITVILIGCGGTYKSQNMTQGERLFRANCRSCHLLPKPTKHTDVEWPSLVKRYGSKIKLSDSTQAAIIEFLRQNN